MIEPDRLLYIRWLAARFLLFQKHLSPVIDVRELELPHHVFIASFSEFSKATGVEEHILTGDGLLSDGYMIRRKNCRIVLYTQSYDTLCPQRLRFSLAHELGHIFLHHSDDDQKSEAEANCFASQVIAHDAIVLALIRGSWKTDLALIREQFGLSWEAAAIKLRSLNRNPRVYHPDEQLLCRKYLTDCRHGSSHSGRKFATAYSTAFIAYEE